MNFSLKKQLLKTFAQMIADLNSLEEAEVFLKDFFSEQELEKYVSRLSTLYWIKKGRDDENIKRNLGATKKDILEAAKLLKKDGVKLAIKKMEAEEWANIWSERIKKIASTKMRV